MGVRFYRGGAVVVAVVVYGGIRWGQKKITEAQQIKTEQKPNIIFYNNGATEPDWQMGANGVKYSILPDLLEK